MKLIRVIEINQHPPNNESVLWLDSNSIPGKFIPKVYNNSGWEELVLENILHSILLGDIKEGLKLLNISFSDSEVMTGFLLNSIYLDTIYKDQLSDSAEQLLTINESLLSIITELLSKEVVTVEDYVLYESTFKEYQNIYKEFNSVVTSTLIQNLIGQDTYYKQYVKDFNETVDWSERNLLIDSNKQLTNNGFPLTSSSIGSYIPSQDEEVTATFKLKLGEGKTRIELYNTADLLLATINSDQIVDDVVQVTFAWQTKDSGEIDKTLDVYIFEEYIQSNSTIEWIKLTKGNRSSKLWTPSLNDSGSSSVVTTNSLIDIKKLLEVNHNESIANYSNVYNDIGLSVEDKLTFKTQYDLLIAAYNKLLVDIDNVIGDPSDATLYVTYTNSLNDYKDLLGEYAGLLYISIDKIQTSEILNLNNSLTNSINTINSTVNTLSSTISTTNETLTKCFGFDTYEELKTFVATTANQFFIKDEDVIKLNSMIANELLNDPTWIENLISQLPESLGRANSLYTDYITINNDGFQAFVDNDKLKAFFKIANQGIDLFWDERNPEINIGTNGISFQADLENNFLSVNFNPELSAFVTGRGSFNLPGVIYAGVRGTYSIASLVSLVDMYKPDPNFNITISRDTSISSTGMYTITHNIGHSNYSVIPYFIENEERMINVAVNKDSITNTSFTIKTISGYTNTYAEGYFGFIIISNK